MENVISKINNSIDYTINENIWKFVEQFLWYTFHSNIRKEVNITSTLSRVDDIIGSSVEFIEDQLMKNLKDKL